MPITTSSRVVAPSTEGVGVRVGTRSDYRRREKATLSATTTADKKCEKNARPATSDEARPEVDYEGGMTGKEDNAVYSSPTLKKGSRKLTLQLIRLRALNEEERSLPADAM